VPGARVSAARRARIIGAATRPESIAIAAAAYAAVAFAAEPSLGAHRQLWIGLGAWALLAGALARLEPDVRVRVAAVVLAASAGEVIFSLGLGLFTYRWHNIPAYVPPGHGLIFTAALSMADRAQAADRERLIVGAALFAALAWFTVGLAVDSRPDDLGLVGLCVLLAFLAQGQRGPLYACVFFVAAPLEVYATSLGTWHWASTAPLLRIPAANPPCAIPAGYILFDAAGLRLRAWLTGAARAFGRRPPARPNSRCAAPQLPRS
jgi:hypothetical protein